MFNSQEQELIKEFLSYDLEHEELSNSSKKIIIDILEKIKNDSTK